MTTTRATTARKKRDSRPAPDAGWTMLPDRRPRKLRPVEPGTPGSGITTDAALRDIAAQIDAASETVAEWSEPVPAPPVEEDVIAVLMEVAFTLDGQPTGVVARMQTVMPRLPADQDALHLQIGLDARQTMQALEPHVGPSGASVTTPKPGLWVPGRS